MQLSGRPSRLPAAFTLDVLSILLYHMRTLGTLSMTTKRGHTSVWHFVEAPDAWYAFGGCHRPLVKRFASVDELRALYRSYISYGYAPMTQQLELPLAA